jgi:competence protein ComEC
MAGAEFVQPTARPARQIFASASQSAFQSALRFVGAAIHDQSLRWSLLLPVALSLGAAAYLLLPAEPGWPAVSVGPPIALALGRLLWRRSGWLSLICLLAAAAGLGAFAGKVRTFLVAAPVLRESIGPVRIEGVVAEVDASERSRRVRIAVRAIEGLPPEQTPKYVRISYRPTIGFGPGRAVGCRAILSPPPRPVVPGDYAFNRDAWFQQLGAVGFAIGDCTPLPTPLPASAVDRAVYWIGALRRDISEHVYEAAGAKGGGMSAAMLAGDRSFLSQQDSEALRLSGLAHLLSISGVHMVLAGGIFFFIIRLLWPLCEPLALRMPTVRVAAFGAIVACTLYFAISGAEVATQRSYVMAMIGFGAKLFDRPALSLRSVAVALSVVVLLQPEAVVTPGFQMSFAASAALIALYEIWPKIDKPEGRGVLTRLRGWIVGAAATSITASFATMPFALYHFNRAALFSVVANLVTTPIISLWTTPAAAAAAVTLPFGLQDFFLAALGKSLETVLAIARWSAELSPNIGLPRLGSTGLLWAALAIGAFCIFTRGGRWLALIPATIAAVLWLTGPQPAAYISADATVYAGDHGKWIELTDWRRFNGLDPLIGGDEVSKADCPGKGAACRLTLTSGVYEISPDPNASIDIEPARKRGARQKDTRPKRDQLTPHPCPSKAELLFTPSGGAPLRLNPCSQSGATGAVIEVGLKGAHIRKDDGQPGRPWSQPVRER